MELLVVVTVIAITAALAAPAIQNAMSERRHMEAAHDLVLLARTARAEAAAYGRAYLIRWDSSSSGSFSLYRGTSSNCNTNDWDGVGAGADIIAGSTCSPPTGHCLGQLAVADTIYTSSGTSVTVTDTGARDDLDLCWEPSGQMKWREGASVGTGGAFSDRNTVSGGFIFLFRRYIGGSPAGVDRRVIVPIGGQPRILR